MQPSAEGHGTRSSFLRGAGMTDEPGDILTIEELAAYLKISKSTLYKLAQEGKIPGQKVGRHWRFHRSTIDRWIGNARPLEAG